MSLFGNSVFVLVVGQLLIFLIQGLPIVRNFEKPEYFAELFKCGLCLGVWVYFFLCAIFKVEITGELIGRYIPILSELITAMFMSLTMHLIVLGAKVKWGTF